MPDRKSNALAVAGLLLACFGQRAAGQAPTISPETTARPGAEASSLGPLPGVGGGNFLDTPSGGQSILGGRPGSTTPRVPTSITTPGAGGDQASTPAMSIPAVPPLTAVPLYGVLELPLSDDEGPESGLTLAQAIDLIVRSNLELTARRYEIPLAQADILQASLRANPLLYADGQLVPYGNYSRLRPGGQTQYDLNVSYPLDLTHKRQARITAAVAARKVVEAQFQEAIRTQVLNVGNAYINVLAARETLRYAEIGFQGIGRVLQASEKLSDTGLRNRADVSRIRAQRDASEVGLLDARENVARAKRVLGGLLAIDPAEAEAIELRGSIRDAGPPPPGVDDLTEMALRCRPDLHAYRLGVGFASAGLRLQRANWLSDAYLLYQPYTFQSNAPVHLKSPHSWALGITVPLPVYNRNQGNIERAKINVNQTQVQLLGLERQVVLDVRQAEAEYTKTRAYLDLFEHGPLASAKAALDDTRKLLAAGELNDVTLLLNVQREYNDLVRQYRDTAIRHRRSMINLNHAVGSPVLP